MQKECRILSLNTSNSEEDGPQQQKITLSCQLGATQVWPKQHEHKDPSCLVSMDQNGSSGGVMCWEMFSRHILVSLMPTELHCSCCCYSASPNHWCYSQMISAVCISQIKCSSTTPKCSVVDCRNCCVAVNHDHAEMLILLCKQGIRPLHSGTSPGSVKLCTPTCLAALTVCGNSFL